MSPCLKDLKEGLSSTRKPDITHVRLPFMIYTARACELGDVKYERSNFLRPTGGEVHTTPTAEDFKRFRAYLRAAASHLFYVLDAMERHQATDPNLEDIEGMKSAAFAPDTDVSPGSRVGASGLPHVSPACSSLMMAITQAVNCGLLPADPGRPWEVTKAETPAQDVPPLPCGAPTHFLEDHPGVWTHCTRAFGHPGHHADDTGRPWERV